MLGSGVADYYPLVSRAVAALKPNTSESRRALYDRVRTAQAAQLGKLDPPAENSVIAREHRALERVISIIESVAIATGHAKTDSEIVGAFTTFCVDGKTEPGFIYDVSVLPYPKHAIVGALERQIVLEAADVRAEWLQQGQMFVWEFLEGVGSAPVPSSRLRPDATPEQIREFAQRIAEGNDRSDRLWSLALEEAERVRQRINVALQIRQERLAIDKDFDHERLRLNDVLSRAPVRKGAVAPKRTPIANFKAAVSGASGSVGFGRGRMSNKRKLVAFLIYAAMIGGGLYLLTDITIRNKGGAVAGAGAVFLMGLGGYLIWTDIIAPALHIKTPED